jgi:CheY-like chemotaxis protein
MPKKIILLVDDEAIILMSLKQELRNSLGDTYAYEMALSGQEALEILEEFHSDSNVLMEGYVISDYLMPGIKGDELIISVMEKYPGFQGILVTGQTDYTVKHKLTGTKGFLATITKPWNIKKILDIIV